MARFRPILVAASRAATASASALSRVMEALVWV
ncbi:hypothetical protein ABID26_006569 [Mesorhizobium shonense]|uniref:Uncharacterized protein n=1 Tax=Mesorhizobium shonense TaxID=1209948 RepID=A0ABV2I2J4_9HYPH